MDSKITLSFDREVIEKAKEYAKSQNISLSRFMEFLLCRITSGSYKTLEEIKVTDWVMQISEGKAEYLTRPRKRKTLRNEFFSKQK